MKKKIKKPDVDNALVGLDMVHSELWQMKNELKQTDGKARIVKAIEIECLEMLVRCIIGSLKGEE
jgi:hypothetical protein